MGRTISPRFSSCGGTPHSVVIAAVAVIKAMNMNLGCSFTHWSLTSSDKYSGQSSQVSVRLFVKLKKTINVFIENFYNNRPVRKGIRISFTCMVTNRMTEHRAVVTPIQLIYYDRSNAVPSVVRWLIINAILVSPY